MTAKWNMIVDVACCENCHNCFLATKDEHVGNDFPGYAAPQPLHGHAWIFLQTNERGQAPIIDAHSMPVMCNHCDNAPCIKAARDDAVYQRPDGIVIIDPVKAKGQQQLVAACPYGAIQWNVELELPQKWIFDAHLLDAGWSRTRAEQVCGTGALKSVKATDEEMEALARKEDLQTLRPELGTKPRVYYKNLHLMTKEFVAGTVVTRSAGVEDAASDVTVELWNVDGLVGEATTDAFGEFKIDGLEPNSGACEIRIHVSAERCVTRKLELSDSQYIGVISL